MALDALRYGLVSLATNLTSSKKIFLISEAASWSIHEDCRNIQRESERLGHPKAAISYIPIGLRKKVIHFASENTLLSQDSIKDTKIHERIDPSNKTVLTWFHISAQDAPRLHLIPLLNDRIDIVHTSSLSTRKKLIDHGLREEKIATVPLGIDLDFFRPAAPNEKELLREKLGIPRDRTVIGSFQKDGNGWGEGLEPKLIKGPDVFCSAVEELAKQHPIHVLLTGPARGYVKRRLEKAGIPYTHSFLRNYLEIPRYYRVLDLYFVTSREEGGPKALLESLASGVPIVSTRVGMAPEVIEEGINGFCVEIEDVRSIVEKASLLLGNSHQKNKIVKNGLETAKRYAMKRVVEEMYRKVYVPLLQKL
jgi:glycosyltransferase involved in cell wall biosynthesis